MPKIFVEAFKIDANGQPFSIGKTGVYEVTEEGSANIIAKNDEFLTSFKPPDERAGGDEVAPDTDTD